MARLATHLPFRQAARECSWFLGVAPSEATVRRVTEAAGAAQVACQEAECGRLEQQALPSPPGPVVQQVSVDGAMVPLVGGEWAEVKTVAIGTVTGVGPPAAGTPTVQTEDWSYFSRLADAETFSHAALVELHRRGTFAAGTVVAPVDGSAWCQGFYELHRPDAVRILDFPHAGEHLSAPARAIWGQGRAATQAWVDQWLPQLKTGDPADVLAAVCQLPIEAAGDPTAAAAVRAATVEYLASRWDQIQYAHFLAQGYPIGSGSVESANKLVVEARLKGSGMHWSRPHVNPLLALRNVVCNDRWAEAWPGMVAQQRQAVAAQRRARHVQRRARPPVPPPPTPPVAPVAVRSSAVATVATHRPPCIVAGRPTAAHPWKRRPFRDLPDRHRLPRSAKT